MPARATRLARSPAISPAAVAHRADRLDKAHDRLAGGRPADSVAAEQADDFAFTDRQVDALQDVALAIKGVQVADFEHHAASAPR